MKRRQQKTEVAPQSTCESLSNTDLDYDSWFRRKVNTGLEQLDRGQYLTHEDVGQRLAKLVPA